MNDLRKELLDIVTQTRMHLELQNALGVGFIETHPGDLLSTGGQEAGPASPAAVRQPETAPAAPANAGKLTDVRRELGDCTRCRLCKGRRNIVFGEGNPEAVLMFIGEGPGQEEDEQGRPFVGAAGQLLTDIIVKGMKLSREAVYICNIVKCRPPENRKPEPDEIEACTPFLQKQIEAIKPKVIIVLGNVAAQSLLGTAEGITKLRGTWRQYQGIRVMPTYHPAYLLRNPSAKKDVWEDIKKVMAAMEEP